MRYSAILASAVGAVVFGLAAPFVPYEDFRIILMILSLLCIALTAVGAWDMIQPNHSLKRNYPILANIRFFLEKIRPEIRQYFLESETDGTPFNRAKRSVAYQRAPRVSSTSARLEPSRTSTPAITSGSIIRSHRVRRKAITIAWSSAGPTASSLIRTRSSTSRR